MQILGHRPTRAEMLLRKGCDFTWELEIDADELVPEGTTVTLYVYPRDSDEVLAFWPAIMVPGEILDPEVIPASPAVPAYTGIVRDATGKPKVVHHAAVPATPETVIAGGLVPDKAQLQIYADDHEIIPDGGRFLVVLEKTGFPKTPWLEGRISKVNR